MSRPTRRRRFVGGRLGSAAAEFVLADRAVGVLVFEVFDQHDPVAALEALWVFVADLQDQARAAVFDAGGAGAAVDRAADGRDLAEDRPRRPRLHLAQQLAQRPQRQRGDRQRQAEVDEDDQSARGDAQRRARHQTQQVDVGVVGQDPADQHDHADHHGDRNAAQAQAHQRIEDAVLRMMRAVDQGVVA
ncbi:hypothetical protein CATMIT_00412 [Catenibacterium mitsuokai DSM 15897]|nr:hypothetical protein CATMIT_00412 [Catenibacterium mitsuokai DSM 15897]